MIGGGLQNVNYGSPYSVMAGGRQNLVNNSWEGCVIGGGEGNYVDGSYSLIGGGLNNSVYGSVSCTIGGGASNTIAGSGLLGATIPGGSGNSANGNNSFAAGTGSTAHNNGSFVWSDSQGGAQDTAQDQVVMSAHGGFVFTNGPIRADAAGLYNFPYAIVRYPNGQQLINSSNALYFGDGTLLSTNHTLLGDGSQLAGINGGTITNSLHNCIILVASNSVVSASATASMVSSNLIYLVDTTAGNVLLTLAPVPGSASFSVYNLGTNSVIETNTPAFNFKVAIGTTLIYTNKVIISGYAGKGQTWTGVNSSNLLLTAHFLTTQQLTDMATNAAWAVTNNLQILAAQINGTIAATNLGQLSLTNLPAGVVTNGSASLVMLGSVNVSNTLSAGTLLITNSALFNTDINIAANHSLVWNNQQGILAWNGGLGSLTGTLSGYNAGPYPISTFSVSVTNFNITGNFNAGLVKATNGIVMPTNSAPTGVVWGTTPPDYWLKQYALPASNIVWTPCWTNH